MTEIGSSPNFHTVAISLWLFCLLFRVDVGHTLGVYPYIHLAISSFGIAHCFLVHCANSTFISYFTDIFLFSY